MSYIEDSLSKNETIVEIYKPHWFAKIPIYIFLLMAIPTLSLTLIFAYFNYLVLKYSEFGATNKRVISKTGIISRKTQEMKINSIETVEIKQGIIGRIFGFGTIKITGRGISDLVFKNIDDPMMVKKSIESIDDN